MFIPLSSLVLGAALLLPVADGVPRFNVEPGCRATASIGDGLDASLSICQADEQSAKAQLEADWSKYSRRLHEICTTLTTTGGFPSYVELLECLIIGQEAQKLEKAQSGDAKH